MREQFNGDVTTLLTHSDLTSGLTVVGGLYQQRVVAIYCWAANYLPATVDAGGHTLTDALYQALTASSWLLATFGGTTIAIFRPPDVASTVRYRVLIDRMYIYEDTVVEWPHIYDE